MRSKVSASVHTLLQPIDVTAKRFSHIHVDIVGPLLATAGGFWYIFTIVERSTRWPEVIPLKGVTTEDCVEAFFMDGLAVLGFPQR
jgi:hypothetical protein